MRKAIKFMDDVTIVVGFIGIITTVFFNKSLMGFISQHWALFLFGLLFVAGVVSALYFKFQEIIDLQKEERLKLEMLHKAMIYLSFYRQTKPREIPARSEFGRQHLIDMQKEEIEAIKKFLSNNFPGSPLNEVQKVADNFFVNPLF